MMKCNKTGLTDKDWRTILDVINVYDPNDIAHVYPEMSTPEFLQDVQSAFKAVLAHVQRLNNINEGSSYGLTKDLLTGIENEQQIYGENNKPAAVDHMTLAYQQWLHDS